MYMYNVKAFYRNSNSQNKINYIPYETNERIKNIHSDFELENICLYGSYWKNNIKNENDLKTDCNLR